MANKKNMSVINEGLKLIHTDNDVHSFFADAESNGKIHLYIAHKKQELGSKEDRIKKVISGMIDDEPVVRKSIKTSRKGKENMYDESPPLDSPTKESKVVLTNYKRAIIHGKAKMVKVEDVGLV
ncbi:hypothetical protein Tco_1357811 [Tanacetum coccineum]